MRPTSILCRAQEAHHRELAAVAQLENVRAIAAGAAAAWGLEALSAERREARQLRLETGPAGDNRDRLISENPDRGFETL